MEQLQAILDSINDILWSNALIILLLASGVYYTIRLNFAQFTKIPLMIKYMFEENTSGTGRTPFQAFALTLSTRVGTGNIAGVATAIALGFCTPGVIALIVKSAFGMEAIYGAILGKTVIWGVKRGIYSNEAGMGTSSQASSTPYVSHPVKQGLVQSFSVYIDTIFVCSATAFIILLTGM